MESLEDFPKQTFLHAKSDKCNRVLIVEDDLTFEMIWQYVLHQADQMAQIEWSTNVSEAENLIKERESENCPFDLIISDIFVSGSKTGVDLWLKFQESYHRRFILVSTAEQINILTYLHSSQEPIYLQKPIIIPEAISAIHDVLQNKTK